MRTRPENNSIYLVLGLGYASILAKCVHNCAHVWRGNRTRVWQMCAQLIVHTVRRGLSSWFSVKTRCYGVVWKERDGEDAKRMT